MIRSVQQSITVAGTAGSATGSGTLGYPLSGLLHAVHYDFTGAAATADTTTTVVAATGSNPALTILTLTDNNTTGFFYPRIQVCGVTGSALTLDGTRIATDRIPINGYLKTAIAQSDAGTVIVTYFIDCS
jgi:hypothetical protein